MSQENLTKWFTSHWNNPKSYGELSPKLQKLITNLSKPKEIVDEIKDIELMEYDNTKKEYIETEIESLDDINATKFKKPTTNKFEEKEEELKKELQQKVKTKKLMKSLRKDFPEKKFDIPDFERIVEDRKIELAKKELKLLTALKEELKRTKTLTEIQPLLDQAEEELTQKELESFKQMTEIQKEIISKGDKK